MPVALPHLFEVPMNYSPQLVGSVTPPPDMIAAARASLSADAFALLMDSIGHRAPTPAELCAAVEAERALTA